MSHLTLCRIFQFVLILGHNKWALGYLNHRSYGGFETILKSYRCREKGEQVMYSHMLIMQ